MSAVGIFVIAAVLLIALVYFDPFHWFVNPRPVNIYDCGYDSKTRGWYDFRGQGVKNDFCRYVGDNPAYFSCQLGNNPGKDDTTLADAVKYDPEAIHDEFDKSKYACRWPAA